MNSPHPSNQRRGRRGYMVAMVLGTALSALGSGAAPATAAPETTVRAVADMSRYCAACWRNARLHPDCWTDCTQEVFSRLVERVTPEAWSRVLKDEGEERREFLRAIDTVKKRTQRSRKASSLATDVADGSDLSGRRLAEERDAVSKAAAELLSDRQRQILALSFEGWQVQDIAKRMRLSAERVSDEKYKAIRRLRAHFDSDGQAA
jgi:RNA polymerase sigma factor (sigma-70 family)